MPGSEPIAGYSLSNSAVRRLTNWLPDEEGVQLRFEFETEIKRLEAA
jgi:hypothetical protein